MRAEDIPGEEEWGGDPARWDPSYVNWARLKPEQNAAHAVFLARQYVDAGFVDLATGKWTHVPMPPEWLLRAWLSLAAMRARAEREERLRVRTDRGSYRS